MPATILAVTEGVALIGAATVAATASVIVAWLNLRQSKRTQESNSYDHGKVVEALHEQGAYMHRLGSAIGEVRASVGGIVDTHGMAQFKSDPQGRLIWANDEALQLVGLPYEDMDNAEKWQKSIHPDDRQAMLDEWAHILEHGEPDGPVEYRYVHPRTGEETPVRARVTVTKHDDGSAKEIHTLVVRLRDSAKTQFD